MLSGKASTASGAPKATPSGMQHIAPACTRTYGFADTITKDGYAPGDRRGAVRGAMESSIRPSYL